MKKGVFLSFAVIAISLTIGCRSMGKSGLRSLVKVVAVEQDCPEENVKILDSFHKSGGGYYKLEACGKIVRYKKIGSVFMEQKAAEKLIDSLQR